MAVPGLAPKIVPRGKVRIGEKRSSGGKEYPSSLDHFACDDPAFSAVAGQKPRSLRIILLHDREEDAFSTGLEWWIKKDNKAPVLACYTKDGGDDPVALRKTQLVDADDVVRGPERGEGRTPITCRSRSCPHFDVRCKPMGRLLFALAADPVPYVWQLDTKSFNSIEALTGSLGVAKSGGRALGQRQFDLGVVMRSSGTSRFPVLTLQEVPVQVNNEKDVANADGLVALERALAEGQPARVALKEYLDYARPWWRSDERYLARIREIGPEAAVAKLLESLS